MNKKINLIINGKGGVGKIFFATSFCSVSERLRHHRQIATRRHQIQQRR